MELRNVVVCVELKLGVRLVSNPVTLIARFHQPPKAAKKRNNAIVLPVSNASAVVPSVPRENSFIPSSCFAGHFFVNIYKTCVL